MRIELKSSYQWPRVVAILFFCWWGLALVILNNLPFGWHVLAAFILAIIAVFGYCRVYRRHINSQPEVIIIDLTACLINGDHYQLKWHSFYLGDWFYLRFEDETFRQQIRSVILSPDMLTIVQKSELRRLLKNFNRIARNSS